MKLILNVTLLIFIFSLFACSSENENDQVLTAEDEKLVSILTDLHFADASLRRYLDKDRDSVMRVFKYQIFSIHDVKQTWFDSSMNSVINQPKRYLNIYDTVADTIDSTYKELRSNK